MTGLVGLHDKHDVSFINEFNFGSKNDILHEYSQNKENVE